MPLPESKPPEKINASIRDVAASWVVRRDRGFSPSEAAEFDQWLQQDPRHAAAIARSSAAWSLLDRIPAHVARPVPVVPLRTVRWHWPALGGLAAAVVLGSFYLRNDPPSRSAPSRDQVAAVAMAGNALQSKVLPDGSLVRLNVGAEVREQFTSTLRSIELTRGEAHFTVTKDPARPFVVLAKGVEVYAVGTAFNVRLDADAVDVVVTEGKVKVTAPQPNSVATPVSATAKIILAEPSYVIAGQRAVVNLAAAITQSIVTVSEVPALQLAEALAWREPLLRLGGATLAELMVEFERQTGRRMVLVDPALSDLRVGGRFHSDDLDGFIRILEQNYGLKSEHATDGSLLLGKKP